MTDKKREQVYMIVWMDGGINCPQPHAKFCATKEEAAAIMEDERTFVEIESPVLLIRGEVLDKYLGG